MTVLIIDDNQALTKNLSSYLSVHYTVHLAASYAEGKQQLDSVQPDLLLLDLNLPDRYGIELCNPLNSSGHPIPTIILSSQTHPYRIATAIEQGAEEYLTKPFSPLVLSAKMQQIISRNKHVYERSDTSRTNPTPPSHPELSLEVKTRTLTYKNTRTHLTPSEVRLCAELLSHPHACSKSRLLETLHADTTAAVLYTHLKNLRKKLHLSSPYTIHAIRQSGFALKKRCDA